MRTNNSIKNATIAICMSLITIIVGFISQKIFVISLGKEYLGLNGLFSNILSMLSVVELGFGSAIIYHLYKPVAKNEYAKINILLQFYKKAYRTIAIVIFILGLLVMPFLEYIIGDVSSIDFNIHLLFFLSLIDIVASYLLTYKRSILYANQKTYIINIVHILYIIILNTAQCIFLLTTKNYIIYLLLKIFFRILENVIITIIANKKYQYICEKNKELLDEETKKDIFIKVKGLLYHNIGGALVQGSDNIIISNLFSVITVGLYSNYYMIINALNNLLGQIFTSITATVGNLLVENNETKSYSIYKKLLFLNSWMYCFIGICLICLIEPFIKIWMGNDYLLPYEVLIILIINFYIQGMRKTNSVFKNAAGIFYEDRFVPIIESIINIVFSIILAKLFGLIGVFIGTILSSMILFLYSYPVFIYKRIFQKKYSSFIKEHIKYLIISIIIAIITVSITNQISLSNNILVLIVNTMICFVIPNIIYVIVFFKTEEFQYFVNLIRKMLFKKSKRS